MKKHSDTKLLTMAFLGSLAVGCDPAVTDDTNDSAAETGGAETGGGEGAAEEGGEGAEEGAEGAEEGTEEGAEEGAEEGPSEEGGSEGGCANDEGADEGGSDGGEGGVDCEEGGETGSEEGGSEGSHCDLHYEDWACAGKTEPFDSFVCDNPSPCGDVHGFGEDYDEGPAGVDDPAALQCIIESLRDGEAGTHYVLLDTAINAFTEWNIESLGDGTVVLHSFDADDKCADVTETWSFLRPADHFDGCLALATDLERLECVVDAASPECVDGETVCP